MIGLKNCTQEEFEYLYEKFHIKTNLNLNIPTFFFSLVLEEKIVGYVKLIYKNENYYLEEIKYDLGMEKFNRFFIKCIAYKIYLKQKKFFYSKIFFENILGIKKIKDGLYSYDIEEILEQGKLCGNCHDNKHKNIN